MIVVLQVDRDVSTVWDVKPPKPALDFEHEWNLVRANVKREAGDEGYDTDEIIRRMQRLGWVFEDVIWSLAED